MLEKKLFDLQLDELNRHVNNLFFLYLLRQIILIGFLINN
jgi:hypothetical protein